MDEKRDLARELAKQHHSEGDPLGWFESLYRKAERDFDTIPWADRAPNPHLVAWCQRTGMPRPGTRVLVTGCGLGDDAEYLAGRGAEVTAIDLSPTAIAWCRERFPESKVCYETANLLEFSGEFDLTVEIYTLQAMPAEFRSAAVEKLRQLTREILVICRGRDETDPPGELPYPLTRTDLAPFGEAESFEDFDDPFDPGKRRFRVHFRLVR